MRSAGAGSGSGNSGQARLISGGPRAVQVWIDGDDEQAATTNTSRARNWLREKWAPLNVYLPAEGDFSELRGFISHFQWDAKERCNLAVVIDADGDDNPVGVQSLPEVVEAAASQPAGVVLLHYNGGESDDEMGVGELAEYRTIGADGESDESDSSDDDAESTANGEPAAASLVSPATVAQSHPPRQRAEQPVRPSALSPVPLALRLRARGPGSLLPSGQGGQGRAYERRLFCLFCRA